MWGPLTEDAIQRALLEKEGGAMPCDADSCPSPVAAGDAITTATTTNNNTGLGWLAIAGIGVAAAGVGLWIARRR